MHQKLRVFILMIANLGLVVVFSVTLMSHDYNKQPKLGVAGLVWVMALFVPWPQSSDHLDHSVNLPKPPPPFIQGGLGGHFSLLFFLYRMLTRCACMMRFMSFDWEFDRRHIAAKAFGVCQQTPKLQSASRWADSTVWRAARRNFSGGPSSCWPVNPNLSLLS